MKKGDRNRGVARAVAYPRDLAVFAGALSHAASRGWCWLDGAGDSGWSYLGIASEVLAAERGREQEFLWALQGEPSFAGEDQGFFGGWVVALSYEFGVGLLELDPEPDDAAPAFGLRLDVVLAVNEAEGRAELRGSTESALDAWMVRFGGGLGIQVGQSGDEPDARSTSIWRQTDAAYLNQVEQAKRAIADGEAYVLCLTDTATASGEFDPIELYLKLREQGAATRGGVLVAGDRALVSASPERFLSVQGGTVATRPIKGTRPRGGDPASDRGYASDLASDPKELAENLMIVDLMRNDLSRVCEPGSVRVEGFQRVETHPQVHQLVSTVAGELRADLGVSDAILACFPGGSMTGAPKRRAVQILAELERGPRGLYAGCFGWIGGGAAELAMTIRGAELRGWDAGAARFREARIGAGGGITGDSDPESELQEKHLKAAALLAAVAGSTHRPGAQATGS